jgi:hypothetical protein
MTQTTATTRVDSHELAEGLRALRAREGELRGRL